MHLCLIVITCFRRIGLDYLCLCPTIRGPVCGLLSPMNPFLCFNSVFDNVFYILMFN